MAEEEKSEVKHEAKKETPNAEAAPKKKDSTLKIVLIIVGVLIGLFLLAWVAMVVFVGSLFNRASKNVSVSGDGKNGQVTVKSNNGENTTTYGNNAKLPDGFPSDVPVFKPSTTVAASKSGTAQFSASVKTNDSVDKVVSYYKDQLAKNGWTLTNENSYGDGTILSFKKDNRTVVVSVSNQANETSEKTFVSLSVDTLEQ